MIVVLIILAFVALLVALFAGALRESQRPRSHAWLVVLPLIAFGGWLLVELIIGH